MFWTLRPQTWVHKSPRKAKDLKSFFAISISSFPLTKGKRGEKKFNLSHKTLKQLKSCHSKKQKVLSHENWSLSLTSQTPERKSKIKFLVKKNYLAQLHPAVSNAHKPIQKQLKKIIIQSLPS